MIQTQNHLKIPLKFLAFKNLGEKKKIEAGLQGEKGGEINAV
jgi:hypothetical protein